MMKPLYYENDEIRKVLQSVKTIAMVGASPNWVRPSNFAMKYLLTKGYRVIPVNPGHAGKKIWDQTVYAKLSDIPETFDMVDIFRTSSAVNGIVDEVLALGSESPVKVVWMQLGVRDDEAAAKAEKAGLQVFMDRCPKIEYGRLLGELSWCGVNSGIITSKKRKLG